MSDIPFKPKKRRLSLSLRVSFGLVLAAILPLILTIAFIEYQTIPALTAQAQNTMQSDAKTRVQLIDTYLKERILDTETLTQVPSLQAFMVLPPPPQTPLAVYQDAQVHAGYSLAAGIFRDKNYATWTMFTPQGQPLLYYPTTAAPKPHGQSLVPAAQLQAVSQGKPFISPVYYSPDTRKASVDIYAPVIPQQPQKVIGFLRATLNLDYIWNIVGGDLHNNGTGSYAFILDENGVRIADTEADRLFMSVAPLPQDIQTSISNEQRFGTANPVTLLADPAVAATLQRNSQTTTFQAQPATQKEQFQIVQQSVSTVPWRYYVLSPVSTVTAVATNQLLVTLLVAIFVSLVAALFGLFAGRGITRPILAAVEYLRGSSQSLSALATGQQDAASEQSWVVDSSQVGLQSVQYYTNATKVAAHLLNQVGTELATHWEQVDARTARLALERMIKAAQYIEEATEYQSSSNEKLSTALKVATQVTEQLVVGTTSATDAATQLEQVVDQLRSVVGK
ncbi:MAG TPA: cache domain-containing protein [Ktedonosporobacter sp.]|nr:cache domain-containing protein [Ktedonosporobacter sp.]